MKIAGLAALGRLFGGLASIATAVLAVRLLSVHEAAAFFIVTAVTRMAASLFSLGRENAVIGAVSHSAAIHGTDESQLSHAVMLRVLRDLSWLWGGAAVAGAGTGLVGSVVDTTLPLMEASAVLMGTAALCVVRVVARGLLSNGRTISGTATESVMGQVALLVVFVIAGSGIRSGAGLAMVQAACLAISALVGGWLASRSSGDSEVPEDSLETAVEFIREQSPSMTWINLAAAAQEQLDVVLVGALGSPEAVNAYALAKRAASPMAMAIAAVAAHFVPQMARVHHTHGTDAGRTEYRALLRQLVVPSVGVMTIFGVAVTIGADVISSGTAGFVPTALLIGVGQFVNLGSGPAGLFLQVTGKSAQVSRVSTVALVAQSAGVLAAVTLWGAIGAAGVVLVVLVTRNLVLLRLVLRGV